jgi:uncharacterized protein YjiS (DUF1127 family)
MHRYHAHPPVEPHYEARHAERANQGAQFAHLAGLLRTWAVRARQRRALAELDDQLLDDIGLTRSEARREAGKPFWSAGKA